MTIHPLFVHFPIALLIIYAILEIITSIYPKYSEKLYLTKIICLYIWALWAIASSQTGEIDKHVNFAKKRTNILERHETFASITTTTSIILSIIYIIISANIVYATNQYIIKYQNYISQTIFYINKFKLLLIWSIILLVSVSITGALWGVVAYGADADPITKVIYSIFG